MEFTCGPLVCLAVLASTVCLVSSELTVDEIIAKEEEKGHFGKDTIIVSHCLGVIQISNGAVPSQS